MYKYVQICVYTKRLSGENGIRREVHSEYVIKYEINIKPKMLLYGQSMKLHSEAMQCRILSSAEGDK